MNETVPIPDIDFGTEAFPLLPPEQIVLADFLQPGDKTKLTDETPFYRISDTENEIQLLRKITQNKGKPLDFWEVSALLETNGLRDVDARKDWGEEDIFALAQRLFRHVDALTYGEKAVIDTRKALIVRVIKNYLKGTLFALPMFLQILSMTVVGFGIWSYVNFSLRQATAISLGTLLALAITGGISQVIGRKGIYYLKMEQLLLACMVTKRLALLGTVLIFVSGIMIFMINVYFKLFPADMFQLFFCYYVLLSLMFVAFAIFYMFEDFGTIAAITLIGIVFTYLFYSVIKIGIVYSQYLSISCMLVASTVVIFLKLRNIQRITKAEGYVLPSTASLFFSLYPYFVFGTGYFLFMITDRSLAWTSGKKYLPYFFWFNYPYEVGVDWALIPLIFTLALVEVFIYELGSMAFTRICHVCATDVNKFNIFFRKVYRKAALTFFAFGAGSTLLAFMFPFFLEQLGYGKYVAVFFGNIHMFVFICASIAYALMAWSLLNCIVFFSYSRPEFAIKSIGMGLLANIVVGYFLSRSLDYYYSVIGLLLGAIVFAIYSTYYAKKFFQRYEYYFYSSF